MMADMYIPSPCITFQDQNNAFCWYLLDGLPCTVGVIDLLKMARWWWPFLDYTCIDLR